MPARFRRGTSTNETITGHQDHVELAPTSELLINRDSGLIQRIERHTTSSDLGAAP